MSEQL